MGGSEATWGSPEANVPRKRIQASNRSSWDTNWKSSGMSSGTSNRIRVGRSDLDPNRIQIGWLNGTRVGSSNGTRFGSSNGTRVGSSNGIRFGSSNGIGFGSELDPNRIASWIGALSYNPHFGPPPARSKSDPIWRSNGIRFGDPTGSDLETPTGPELDRWDRNLASCFRPRSAVPADL